MILIKALVAVIHACLKAVAAVALAMGTFFAAAVVLIVIAFAVLIFFGFTGVGTIRFARNRRKGRSSPGEL